MDAETGARSKRSRRLLLTGGTAVVLGSAAAAFWIKYPWLGQPLTEDERDHLLEQAGLPPKFPIHPYARRATQPALGGFTYGLQEPVPLVLDWQLDSLRRAGFNVFSADLAGQDDTSPHWLYFRAATGESGAIIIRPGQGRAAPGTEVKVLSRGDARLIPPTVPPGLLPPELRGP